MRKFIIGLIVGALIGFALTHAHIHINAQKGDTHLEININD